MTDVYSNYYYWGLDFPGMTRAEADALLNREKVRVGGINGLLVNPSIFLTQHMDKETVEALLSELKRGISEVLPENNSARHPGIRAMIEEFENWLQFASGMGPERLP